jgi:hypothetical protein
LKKHVKTCIGLGVGRRFESCSGRFVSKGFRQLAGSVVTGQPELTISVGRRLMASREYISTPSLEPVASTKL